MIVVTLFLQATRRGLGAAMLRRPSKLATLVRDTVRELEPLDIPLTVKIRTGIACAWIIRSVNCLPSHH
jgi:tRNA-dihydrouridine synthase